MLRKRSTTLFFIFAAILFIGGGCKDKEPEAIHHEIRSFSVVDQNGINHELSVNSSQNTITNRETLPKHVNLSRLVAQFKTNHESTIVKIDGVTQQSGKGYTDFRDPIIYDLFMDDVKQRSYTVNIKKEPLANTFKTFAFSDRTMRQFPVTIDEETGEISNENELPTNIDITALQPTFTLNESNAVVKVNGVQQVSGVQRQDFSKPVLYTVEGVDGSSRIYTVSLKQGDFFAIKNPVMEGGYADPTVIRIDDEFYAYVTGGRVRGYRSSD